MGSTLTILIIIGVVGVSAAAALWSWHNEKQRRTSMEGLANSLGLEFFPSGHSELLSRLRRFQLFNSGRSRVMANAILGETEMASIAIFDYRYTTGGGKNRTVHSQTVVAMESAALNLPSFTLRPEHLFDAVGSALGLQDIDFADHPRFSKMYVLKGRDEAAIREFFDTPLLDFFADRSGINFECGPGMFIYFRARKRQKVDEIRRYLEEGYSVYQAFTDRLSRM